MRKVRKVRILKILTFLMQNTICKAVYMLSGIIVFEEVHPDLHLLVGVRITVDVRDDTFEDVFVSEVHESCQFAVVRSRYIPDMDGVLAFVHIVRASAFGYFVSRIVEQSDSIVVMLVLVLTNHD